MLFEQVKLSPVTDGRYFTVVSGRSTTLAHSTVHIQLPHTLATLVTMSGSPVHRCTTLALGTVDRFFCNTHYTLGAVFVVLLG